MFFKHEFSTLQRAKVPRRDKNRTKRHKAQALYNSRLMSPTPSKAQVPYSPKCWVCCSRWASFLYRH